ncbi:MAG: TonB-dependent siderophore receptor [Candidatus Nitrotoga sp.]|nr:TonB-dependent siderophore receptor [Candidatus Nitrotoga sp.]MDW7625454.1 TonB-dependent siderophore receptor [Candidatus Nitrotoga sp.]
MNTLRHKLRTNLALKNSGDNIRHGGQRVKLVLAAMICLGVVALPALAETNAQPNITASAVAQTYQIPSGMLRDALKGFAKQAGIALYFKGVNLQGVTTQGLSGNHTTKDGLDRLLAEAGLYAVPKGNGYLIQKVSPAVVASNPTPSLAPIESQVVVPVVSSAKPIEKEIALPVASKPSPSPSLVEKEAVLPTVSVSATAAKNVDGYTVKRTSTATKTDTLLRDIPQSISVVTQAVIKDQAIQNMADTVRYVPGVGISQGEGNRDALVFRGNRSTADFFVNGVRDDVQYYRDIYNTESVEVLKGPNGMIFGRGGSGGVINRVMKEADWKPTREITAQVGSFDTKRVALDVGQGVNEVVAVRLNAVHEDSGSFRNGVELKRSGINPTVTVMPTEKTKVVLNAEYAKDDRTADRGIPSTGVGTVASPTGPLKTDPSTFFGDPDRSKSNSELAAFNALVEHKLDNDVTIRNRTRYTAQNKFYQNVYPDSISGSTVTLKAYNDTTDRDTLFNQTDLLFSMNTGQVKHDMAVGLELGHQDTDNLRRTGKFNNNTTTTTVTLPSTTTTTPITFANSGSDANNNSVMKQTSLYAQDQINLLPELQAILGLRYDRYEVGFVNNNTGVSIDRNDNLFSPRAGLVYKPIETASIYTNYSLAYVPRSGEQLTSITTGVATLAPEKFKNTEIGAKWDINPSLALNTAVFQLDRSNVILPDPTDTTKAILGGGQRNRGFELGLTGRITSVWSVMGGYTYQHGVITSAQASTVSGGVAAAKGATLAELPKNNFSLWNRYNINQTWGAGLGIITRGPMYAAIDNKTQLPGFARVDAAVYAKINKDVKFQLNIENLFDTQYYASAHNNNNITPGSPIAIRLSVTSNF